MNLLNHSRYMLQNFIYIQPCKNSTYCKTFISLPQRNLYSSWFNNIHGSHSCKYFKADYVRENYCNKSYVNLLLYSFKAALKRMPVVLKGHSMNIVKHCVEQCEFIVAYRIRRTQQVFNLYTKIWDEIALRQFVIKLRRKFSKKGKYWVLSSAAMYNWDEERISNDEIFRLKNEMLVIKELKEKKFCKKIDINDKCTCFNCMEPNEKEWDIFIDEPNLTVWKKEETTHIGEGLFCYKFYGRYDDVCALDFLEAQVDLDYRLTWDAHAVKLRIIDTERSTRSDVIYWETKWPTPFSNRDYVFKRRYYIDNKNKVLYLANRNTEHPSCPVLTNKQRIKEYWSYMVIKPFDDLDKPGLEFSLTYFDNPGMAMPSSLSSYVTVTGMPIFLKNLHNAAKSLKDKRKGPSILFDDDPEDKNPSDKKRKDKSPSSSGSDDKPKEPKKKCPKLPDMSNFQKIFNSFFFV